MTRLPRRRRSLARVTPSRRSPGTSGSTSHAHYDETLRQGILDEAVRRLRDAEPEGLGLRPLAASQDTSTTAIYTLFGGKAGLLAEVAQEADRQLAAALRESLRHNSVVGDMRSLCRAYRQWALDNRGLYGLVVAEPARSSQWREPLLQVVDALVDEDVFRTADVHETTTAIWASLHGVVSLESSVWRESPSAEQYFETQLAAILRSWTAGAQDSSATRDAATGTAG